MRERIPSRTDVGETATDESARDAADDEPRECSEAESGSGAGGRSRSRQMNCGGAVRGPQSRTCERRRATAHLDVARETVVKAVLEALQERAVGRQAEGYVSLASLRPSRTSKGRGKRTAAGSTCLATRAGARAACAAARRACTRRAPRSRASGAGRSGSAARILKQSEDVRRARAKRKKGPSRTHSKTRCRA